MDPDPVEQGSSNSPGKEMVLDSAPCRWGEDTIQYHKPLDTCPKVACSSLQIPDKEWENHLSMIEDMISQEETKVQLPMQRIQMEMNIQKLFKTRHKIKIHSFHPTPYCWTQTPIPLLVFLYLIFLPDFLPPYLPVLLFAFNHPEQSVPGTHSTLSSLGHCTHCCLCLDFSYLYLSFTLKSQFFRESFSDTTPRNR